jgi:hypothetical protein
VTGRHFGVCVFVGTDLALGPQIEFLREALHRGAGLVMTSLHLPEMEMDRAVVECAAVAAETRGAGAFFFADISELTLRRAGATPSDLRPLADLGLDGVRPDYGFEPDQLVAMGRADRVRLVLNATDTRDETLLILKGKGVALDGGWAVHNYFPRPETGISMARLAAAGRLRRLGLGVAGFVASASTRRGPIHEGLPTVEDLRDAPCADAAGVLFASHAVDAVLLGDPSLDSSELAALADAAANAVVRIRARVAAASENPTQVAQAERQVMEHRHTVWGLSDALVRTGNPALGPAAGAIAPRPGAPRPAYSVTVDNDRYLRFSGTLHIVRRDLPADERVNVVGAVDPRDRRLVDLLEPGDRLQFVWTS